MCTVFQNVIDPTQIEGRMSSLTVGPIPANHRPPQRTTVPFESFVGTNTESLHPLK